MRYTKKSVLVKARTSAITLSSLKCEEYTWETEEKVMLVKVHFFTELFLIRGYLPLFPTGILYYTKAGLSQKLGTVPLLL